HEHQITADADGVITTMDALGVGIAAWRLGAGRARKEDDVQAGAGIYLPKVLGETVKRGEPIMTLHTDTEAAFERAISALGEARDGAGAVEIGADARERALILDTITGS